MNNFNVKQIGHIEVNENQFLIRLNKDYIPALKGLKEFSYIQILWWFNKADTLEKRNLLIEKKPYSNGPDELGVFATRSPFRPNPIALTTVYVLDVDDHNGIIFISYCDAIHNTPVLDIKPYIPSIDRVKTLEMPMWCSHWPDSYETSGEFDWENEFNFEENC